MKTLEKPTWRDRQRWFLWKQEKPLEEIAARERVTVDRVQKSIDTVEMYRYSGAFEEVDLATNHSALRLIEDKEHALRSAMMAGKFEKLPDGSVQLLPDHEVRIKAVEVANEMAVSIRPKAPGSQINVQTNVANGMNGGGNGGGMSFESRLREIKARREMAQLRGEDRMLEATVTTPSNAEQIAAEFEEIGIDLEESDLPELEEEEDAEDIEGGNDGDAKD